MPKTKDKLPPINVGEAGYELLNEMRRSEHDLPSMSDLVRQLIAESPRLISFAQSKGLEISLSVAPHGGYRERK